jgi:RNA-directed DNA polymerase
MTRTFPGVQFERFADDVVIHCGTEREARQVRVAVGQRFAEIGLEVHPDKTRIVYCKDSNRRREYEQVTFTFCGYTFRPREAINRRGQVFTAFLPAVSPEKLNEMSRRIRSWRLHRRINLTLADLAKVVNPVLRGWLNCFTAFYPSAVSTLCRRIDRHLVRWARWKYKRLKRAGRRARAWLQGVRERAPLLFAHWAVRDG